ncbi:YraN family protein [Rhizobium sp. FKY42]|uniref:YraN family protein n=1 Tax=Rhizobium sp. FKY42 TaxID=2562310 RepID=UPI0010BF85C3|nr:YraN family protein [Rhizobium sp. FKY42]
MPKTVRDDGKRRRHAERRGRFAEFLAALYLMSKGYRIVATRYRTPLGEIDLIARKGNIIAFVEVKARKSENSAVEAVSFHSQNRIRAASDLWLARQRKASGLSLRYDIVAITPWRLPSHFVDAF